ncbi:hypothetical protein [Gilvimarinus chinensis]|uniref:hypothetical protein n=1 Tax=Gilvimarinus chinensis TaxID=396005 RepID=UPI000362B0E5|nr:hypothetical protein [Gilvimarinus chinensis]
MEINWRDDNSGQFYDKLVILPGHPRKVARQLAKHCFLWREAAALGEALGFCSEEFGRCRRLLSWFCRML